MAIIPDDNTLDRMESILNIASDFTRLKILYCILGEQKSVNQIAEETGASQSLVSHQLSILKKNHLVSATRNGHNVFYQLDDEHVEQLLEITFDHVNEEWNDGRN